MDQILELVLTIKLIKYVFHLFREAIPFFKDLVIAVTAIFGTVQGYKTLKQWRLKMKGKDQYDVAKRVALKTIELAESLHSARFSREWYKEHEELYKKKLLSKEPEDYREKEYLRFQTKVDIAHGYWTELKQLGFHAQVCGIEIQDKYIEEFFELRGRIAVSAGYVFRTGPNLSNKNDKKYEKEIEIINGVKDDKFGMEIEIAKENVLEIVKEYLE